MAKKKKPLKKVKKSVPAKKKSAGKKKIATTKTKIQSAQKAKKVVTKKAVKKVVQKNVQKAVSKAKAKPKPTVQKAKAKVVVPSVKKAAVVQIDYSKAVTPLGDRLVVRKSVAERLTAGGLIIPDMVNTTEGNIQAVVLATGSGSKNKKGHVRPMDVQVGDQVLFSQYAGTPIIFNNEELMIIHESDVLGILNK